MSIYSGTRQAEAAEKAGELQAAASERATQAQIEAARPWREAGIYGLNQLARLIAAGPGGRTSALTYPTTPSPAGAPATTQPTPSSASGYWALMVGDSEGGPPIEIMQGGSDPNQPPGAAAGGGTWQWIAGGQPTTGAGVPGVGGPSGPVTNLPNIPEDWGSDWQSRYKESPYYNFLLEKGITAQERGAAARGKQLSGGQQKALTEYGQNMASTDYRNWLSDWYNSLTPWQSMSQVGMTSSMQTAPGIANTMMAGGAAQAAGQLGQANAYNKMIGNIGNNALNYYMYGRGGQGAGTINGLGQGNVNYGSGWNPNYASTYGAYEAAPAMYDYYSMAGYM